MTSPASRSAPLPSVERLWVVVLNWQLPDDTAACLASLVAAGVPPGQIIVVDNGSADDSVDRLRRTADPAVTILALSENRGFAAGNNVGIRAALEAGAEWVWLLNNDTLVAPDCPQRLAAAARRHPGYHLLSPLIVYHDEPSRIWSLGDRRMAGTLLTRGLYRDRPLPAALPELIPVDFLSACSLLVQREVFAAAGMLDERYFMYGEDADFCLRAARCGFRLGCATQAQVRHKVSRSTQAARPTRLALKLSSQIRFYRAHAGRVQQVGLALFTLGRALRQTAAAQIARPWPPDGALLRAWARAWSNPL